ncbi:UPF0502 protein [Geomonas silvestris]|uniref:UPF0502 protein n=1 Tax=Geomonas silvestris TaxID=2740184 RepID=A0A6V8MH12_9BACT|nr:YceH family protein [Geomonas silvestris]GFO58979.1 UPF0502 protein [Geomonas silvestris]
MKMNLTDLEIRVLGSLMEKELTTPENYPLSLNSLMSACNQKSNRDPVLSLTESEVQKVLEGLGARGLARLTTTGGRVAKYVHSAADKLGLGVAARAILAELMLRGAQTAGELRNRAERMAPFADIEAVDAVLGELMRETPPMVVRLPRQPGRKEVRYAQVFGGMPELPEEVEEAEDVEPARERALPYKLPMTGRLLKLENEIADLRAETAALRREVEEFLAQFG